MNPDPEATFAGLPLLTVVKQQRGPNLPESPRPWLLDVEMPLLRSEAPPPAPARSNTLIVNWPLVGYTYCPDLPLEPTWILYGQSADGTTHFVLRAPAVEDGVE